jgi:hypothetical protein
MIPWRIESARSRVEARIFERLIWYIGVGPGAWPHALALLHRFQRLAYDFRTGCIDFDEAADLLGAEATGDSRSVESLGSHFGSTSYRRSATLALSRIDTELSNWFGHGLGWRLNSAGDCGLVSSPDDYGHGEPGDGPSLATRLQNKPDHVFRAAAKLGFANLKSATTQLREGTLGRGHPPTPHSLVACFAGELLDPRGATAGERQREAATQRQIEDLCAERTALKQCIDFRERATRLQRVRRPPADFGPLGANGGVLRGMRWVPGTNSLTACPTERWLHSALSTMQSPYLRHGLRTLHDIQCADPPEGHRIEVIGDAIRLHEVVMCAQERQDPRQGCSPCAWHALCRFGCPDGPALCEACDKACGAASTPDELRIAIWELCSDDLRRELRDTSAVLERHPSPGDPVLW